MIENSFTTLSNEFLTDQNISFNAKGTLIFLMSHPEDFEPTISYVSEKLGKSRSTVSRYFKELVEHGYMFRYQERSEDGTFGEWKTCVCDCKEEVAKFKENLNIC